MSKLLFKFGLWVLLLSVSSNNLWAKAEKFRAMYREDPATSIVIGWNQVSGAFPVMLIDVIDHGDNADAYSTIVEPSYFVDAKGMNNHFVRLRNLHPNKTYYFVIRDSEGVSQRFYFQTLPNNPNERLSIIAGGDSRNNIEARREANYLVSKLRPHVVLFGGDMTGGDTDLEWQKWLEDWQLTITKDGRITPIIVARGNHESSNQSLIDIFDVKSRDLYYALTLGGNLIRVYTLNSMIPCGGHQRSWLERDLKANPRVIWKMAQYHKTIRPHTSKKPDHNDQYIDWAGLFYKYGVNMVVESDAHVVKSTWPIRPSDDRGSENGFIRDDINGTVYVGEGCWGAPLRPNDNDKSWTRNSGSFNQFKWIFVDREQIEIRTLKTDGARSVGEVNPQDVFAAPYGLQIWSPSNGDVITIYKDKDLARINSIPSLKHEEPSIGSLNRRQQPPGSTVTATMKRMEIIDFQVNLNDTDIEVAWQTANEAPGTDFEIERSLDNGKTYTPLTIVQGLGEPVNDYSFMDWKVGEKYPGQYISYRLKIINSGKDTPSNMPQIRPRKMPDRPKPTLDKTVTKLEPDASGNLKMSFQLYQPCDVTILLLNPRMELVKRASLKGKNKGNHIASISVADVTPGRYQLIVKGGKDVVKRYRVSF